MYDKIVEFFKSRTIISCLKIFFVWLVCQFMLHTFITYMIHLPDTGVFSIIRMRKELLIIWLWIRGIYFLYRNNKRKEYLQEQKRLVILLWLIIISMILWLLTSMIIHGQSIMTFALSAKFNYFPLIILIVGWLVGSIIGQKDRDTVIDYVIIVIKYVMIFSLIRYLLLHTFPNVLDRIGYSQPGMSIEWTANTPPPSLRLTNFYDGFIRNQWPFGWPLSLWFYMVCLFPLFYSKVLYKQKISQVWHRRALYAFTTISTFSRATWIMRLIQLLLIAAIVYRRYIIPIIIGSFIGLWWLVGYAIVSDQTDIFIRKRSDQWHEKFLNAWIEYIKDNRLRWKGAASVGPASYHNDDWSVAFNTENQYMQVRIEYGLIWFLSRIGIYIIIGVLSWRWWRSLRRWQWIVDVDHLVRAWPFVALAALSVGGMALHPLTDSSSMYPLMMIVWLTLGEWSQYRTKNETTSQMRFDGEKKASSLKRLSRWKYATITIMLFFVIQTQIVNGWWLFSSSLVMSSMRDTVVVIVWMVTLFLYRRNIGSFFAKYKYLLIILVLLLIRSLISGYLYDTSILHFLAGIKFDLSYLILLVIGLWRWHCIAQSERWYTLLVSFFNRLRKLLPWMVIIWIIWQWCKIVWPDFFIQYGWYGMIGDFAPRSHPPMYYITGPWGIPRLSGLFVWPNTFWFFLILFGGWWLYHLRDKKVGRTYFMSACLWYMACVIATLSRSTILAVALQAMIISLIPIIQWGRIVREKVRSYLSRWAIRMIIIISLSGSIIIVMNKWKNTSNGERMSSLQESYSLLMTNPISGYGPWYVGPARHYHPDYAIHPKNTLALVENIYLQIRINLWLPWIILRSCLRCIVFHYGRKNFKEIGENEKVNTLRRIFLMLSISLFSLLCVGWFLDVFIDSMVNYLFFIPFGILIGVLPSWNTRHMKHDHVNGDILLK